MSVITTVLAFLVALAVLIVVHELGHYAVARAAGVRVLRFSVGFGRPIWRRVIGPDGTEWALGAVPLGGYVKMLDETEGTVAPEERHRAFNRQNVWKRAAIVGAGPLANFLLAVVLYWGLYVYGVPEAKPVVNAPDPGSLAAAAGLKRGDTVLRINGDAVATWQEVRWRLLQLAVDRQSARLEVLERGQRIEWHTLELGKFTADALDGDPLVRMGLRLYRPEIEPVIGKLSAGGVAERGGLRAGDRVLAIDGRPTASWEELVAGVRAHPGQPLRLDIQRGAGRMVVDLVPEAIEKDGERFGRIGAAPLIDSQAMRGMVTMVSYGPWDALRFALSRTWETGTFSLRMLGKMLLGEVSWKNLSGPVTIADYAGQSAQLGVAAYVAFIALISISLGVLNLLPIPLLDGGHLLYYVIEIVKGSPVSERVIELGQRFGLSLLLFLMAFAFYNDINRLVSG